MAKQSPAAPGVAFIAPRPPSTDRAALRGPALLLAAILASAAPAAAAEACRATLGPNRAATLVARCAAVSPATRPPCNAGNPCALIEDEIARGCALLDDEAPDFCSAYRMDR